MPSKLSHSFRYAGGHWLIRLFASTKSGDDDGDDDNESNGTQVVNHLNLDFLPAFQTQAALATNYRHSIAPNYLLLSLHIELVIE